MAITWPMGARVRLDRDLVIDCTVPQSEKVAQPLDFINDCCNTRLKQSGKDSASRIELKSLSDSLRAGGGIGL
jgi:hypothetical protein